MNINGGTLGVGFTADSGSEVNILGEQFFIDGLELDTLELGQAFTIFDRDVTLSGILADGQQFSFELNSNSLIGQDFFDPNATVTVTLTKPGDVNRDGFVNFSDISPFIDLLSSQEFQFEADLDRNGVVDFFDISPFIELLAAI